MCVVPHYVYVIIIMVFLDLMYFFLLYLKWYSLWCDVLGMKLVLSLLFTSSVWRSFERYVTSSPVEFLWLLAKFNFGEEILEKITRKEYHGNPFNESKGIIWERNNRRTDRHYEANNCFFAVCCGSVQEFGSLKCQNLGKLRRILIKFYHFFKLAFNNVTWCSGLWWRSNTINLPSVYCTMFYSRGYMREIESIYCGNIILRALVWICK